MKHAGHFSQQLPRSSPYKHDAATLCGLSSGLGQAVQILLMRRVQAEAIGRADGFLVQSVKFGVGHVLDFGGPMQQSTVKHFPT